MKTKGSSFLKSMTAVLLLWCVPVLNSNGQFYTNSGISITPTHSSSVNWIDIDGDGDLDFSISGDDFLLSVGQGELYINTNNVFTFERDIRPMLKGDMTWCDFNNDSIPDLLYAGDTADICAGIDTFDIFNNFNFNSLFSGFTPVSKASVDWGDYDNDGDYDVLIAGKDADENAISTLYRNNNGSFTDVEAGLPGIIDGKVGFIDYDLDQDMDIFICGKDINSNKYTRLWQNNNGIYSITNHIFLNVYYSQWDWGDFNGDGYPDLLLQGYDGSNKRGLIYINNSGENFSMSDTIVPGSIYGSSGFGDVDNDGDLDVFCSGSKQYSSLNEKLIFLNIGTDSLIASSYNTDALSISHFQFGDYDGDNDLDFIVNGRLASWAGLTQIAEDICVPSNSKPMAPQNLTTTVTGTQVLLTWDHGTDNNTPQKSLTYNIYIGTTSEGVDIVSPHASIPDGFRKISKQGYIQDTVWVIKDLPAGTYYWGVQSIDNSFSPSLFSDEDTFEIMNRFTEDTYSEVPSVTSPAMYFDCDHDNDHDIILTGSNELIISVNTVTGFSQDNYDTIYNEAFNPIYTITPNDYNNNNLIDFSISGDHTTDESLDSTIFLVGYNSAFDYEIIDSFLIKNIDFEYVLWFDMNNDGLQDIITSGDSADLKPVTYIYQNMGDSTFQKKTHSIRGFEQCGAVTGDFDNDMDSDIIIYGKDLSGLPNTFLYVNEGGFNFTEQLIPNNDLFRRYLRYGIFTGDFDLNGELDVYMVGRSSQNDTYARILLNNNLAFTDANLPIRSWAFMSNFWADYDYDGDLDIFSTSVTYGSDEMKLYLNNNQSMEEITIDLGSTHQLTMPFMAANLDNENGLDFLMKNSIGEYYQYYDNWGSNNRINTSPDNTGYERDNLDVILSWDKLADCPGCTYNIWIGTHPDSVNIMSPMADKVSGFRYVIQPGNAYLNNRWKISGLPADTYYWSVQAIDLANTGGPWAEMDSFILTNVNPEFTFDTVCLGDTTHFIDLSVATDNVVGWKWNFDDGSTSTVQNPKHVYAIADTFDVTLWAYSESGDSSVQSHDVIVMATPVTDFSADIACLGTLTNFINNTNNNGLTISYWNWDFDDGHYSTVEDPGTNGYANSGEYLVKLIAIADNSCSDSIQKTVTVAAYPSVAVTSNLPLEFCKGDSTILSVDYDINNSYQWLLNDANITDADSSKFTAKLTGNYKVEVINNTGNCDTISSGVDVIAESAPSSPSISYTGNTTFCNGDSIQLSVTNNTSLDYQWKLNTGDIGIDTNIYYAKSLGNYTLEVSNSAGCVALSSNSVDIVVNDIPTIPSINLSGPTSFCSGDSVIISVTNNPVHTYQWKNEFGNISGATTNEITVKEAGIYNLEVTNSSNCSVETEPVIVTVSESPSIPVIVYSGSTTFCNGDSIQLSVTNNTSLDYQWKLNTGDIGIDTNIYYAKSSGNYILEVSNSAGCVALSSNSVDIVVNDIPTIPSINLSGPTSFCSGDSVIISVTNNTAYTYQWKNEFGNISGATTNEITVKETGTYNLEVTNSSNCSVETEPVIVTVLESPSIPVIVYSGSTTFCNGDSIQLSVTNNTSLDYQWKLNTGDIGIDTNIYYAKSSGNYILEVSNTSGCVALSSNSVDIIVNDIPTIPSINLSGPTSFCSGDSLIISVTDNTAYTYQWKNEYGNVQGATTNEITVKETGNYYLLVSNSNNCFVETESTIVSVLESPSIPVIVYTGSTAFCSGDSVQLYVSNNPALNYLWKLNGGAIGVDTNLYIAKLSGNYTLDVSNAGGCVALSSNSVDVTVNEVPDKPVVSLSGLTGFCEGDSLVLSADEHAGLTYQWCNENGEILNANSNQYITYNSGDFYLNITNSSSCTNTSNTTNVTVSEMPLKPVINTTGYDINDCPQEKVIILSVDQPTVQYDYQWKRNGVPIDGETGSTIEDYLNEGDYSVIADNNGCANESDITGIYYDPELPDKPGIIATGPNVWYLACTNDKAQQYEWYYNNEIIGGANAYLYVANQTLGTYFVKIAEENGCFVSSDAVTIPLSATGIDDINPFAGLKIYPNPTPGMFTIEMDNQLYGELFIFIYTQEGKEVFNIKFYKNTQHFKTQIDLSGQGSGLYVILLSLDNYKTERKLIIE